MEHHGRHKTVVLFGAGQAGAIMIHDYNSMQFPGVGKAVREFCSGNGISCLPLGDLHGTAVVFRQ